MAADKDTSTSQKLERQSEARVAVHFSGAASEAVRPD
jgi:hypothetical protein